MTKRMIALAACVAGVVLIAGVAIGATYFSSNTPENVAATSSPTKDWGELGTKLVQISAMTNDQPCTTQECREGRYIASGIILSQLDQYPDDSNKPSLEKVATDYHEIYNEYMSYDCDKGVYSFECQTSERIMDARGIILPKVATLLITGIPIPDFS